MASTPDEASQIELEPGGAGIRRAPSLVAYLSRLSWCPLDIVSLSPRSANSFGLVQFQRIIVDVAGVHASLLVVPDEGVCDGDLLVPPWFGKLLGPSPDGCTATVTSARPPEAESLPSVVSDALQSVESQLGSTCIEIEGPILATSTCSAMVSYFILARKHLRDAICRQVSRAGIHVASGATFAVRISGYAGGSHLASYHNISQLWPQHSTVMLKRWGATN